jgi:trimeric autotransporter adhesin
MSKCLYFKNAAVIWLAMAIIILAGPSSYGQLTGTKTIPGDYATIAAAIADLNTNGVGTGGVTFNVTAGHTETTTETIIVTTPGISGNAIVFQKSGAGANPKITRTDAGTLATTTLGADGDAVIRLNGTDYITFDGIDVTASDAGIEYGYYTFKPSGTDGCKYVSILNSIITLAGGGNYMIGIHISNGPTSLSSATGVAVSDVSGANENIIISGNTITSVLTGIYLRGATGYNDDNISAGTSTAGNILQYGGSTTAYGVYSIYVNNLKIAKNTFTGTGSSTLYGLYTSTATNANVDIFENLVTLTSTATTSSLYGISNASGSTGTTNTINIYDNIVENCTQSSATTGTSYYCYNSASAFTVNMYGNIVRNNTKIGSGTSYVLYNSGGAANGTSNIYDNDIYSNELGTGVAYWLYVNESSTTTKKIYNNSVINNTSGGTGHGIYTSLGFAEIYNNEVYNITSTSTGTTNPTVTGITVGSGSQVNVYNNFVSDLKAPASAATDGVRGISVISSTATSTVGLYYNTVFLNAVSTGANFGSTGIYQTNSTTATTAALDMRNNNVVNNSTPSGTGLTVAFRRSAVNANLNNYTEISNNNNFYAGSPGESNVIFSDGTNNFQTLSAFQLYAVPREAVSVSGNPPFINATTAPYNLHIDTTVATQLESAGTPITAPIAITTDFDGNTRNVSTPDIGADEFNGISADLTAPAITYTPLQNTSVLTNRTLSATITDASGVPTTGIGLPVLYWKVNEGSYTAATGVFVSGDTYQFTFGGGVTVGDVVSYYIAAQDIASPANVGVFPFTGAAGFSANPPAVSTPPTSPSSYIVIDLPLAGVYTVGLAEFNAKTGKNVYFERRTRTVVRDLNGVNSAIDLNEGYDDKENPKPIDRSPRMVEVTETYLEMMENGKPFDQSFFLSPESRGIYPTLTAAVNDLNLRGVSGPVTFSLVDAVYPNETYPIDIYDFIGTSAVNTVTIKPAAGVQTVIPGSVDQTTATLRVGYGSYVIVDGSNTVGGTTKDMTVIGLASGTTPAIHLWGPANNNVFKNLILESQNSSTGSGTFLFGSGPAAMDNNLVENCTIKNIDTAAVRPGVGVYFFSSNTGSGNQIVNCEIFDFADYGIRLQGSPITNILVSGCSIYMNTPSAKSTVYGVYTSRVTGLVLENNIISELTSVSPTTIAGIYYYGGTDASGIVKNNLVFLSRYTNLEAGTLRGLDYYGGTTTSIEAYYNTIHIAGEGVTGGTTNALTKRLSAASYKVYNNVFYNSRSNSSGTGKHYAVYISNTTAPTFEMNNNSYFTDGVGGVFGYYSADVADLAAWIAASSKDSNSLGVDPLLYQYKPTTGSPLLLAGTPVAGITTDILGDPRHVSTPTIGAYELAVTPPMSSVDWCNLQWPGTAQVMQGNSVTVYAQAYEDGLTPLPGQSPGLLCWIGISKKILIRIPGQPGYRQYIMLMSVIMMSSWQ